MKKISPYASMSVRCGGVAAPIGRPIGISRPTLTARPGQTSAPNASIASHLTSTSFIPPSIKPRFFASDTEQTNIPVTQESSGEKTTSGESSQQISTQPRTRALRRRRERRDPFALDLFDPFDDFEDFFFPSTTWSSLLRPTLPLRPTFDLIAPRDIIDIDVWNPRADLSEDKDAFRIHAELPGVPKENIQLKVERDVLTIKGEKKEEKVKEDTNYYRRERSMGSFVRRFQLPDNVDRKGVKASFKDGVLEVTLPKTEGSTEQTINID